MSSAEGERRVSLIEVVSRANEETRQRALAFRGKVIESLEAGLHVLLLDVLPSPRTVRSLAAEIARDLGATEPLDPEPRAATSFESQLDPWEIRVYHEPFVVGAPLPPARLFLEVGRDVLVPLERTYVDALDTLSDRDQARLVRRT